GRRRKLQIAPGARRSPARSPSSFRGKQNEHVLPSQRSTAAPRPLPVLACPLTNRASWLSTLMAWRKSGRPAEYEAVKSYYIRFWIFRIHPKVETLPEVNRRRRENRGLPFAKTIVSILFSETSVWE